MAKAQILNLSTNVKDVKVQTSLQNNADLRQKVKAKDNCVGLKDQASD